MTLAKRLSFLALALTLIAAAPAARGTTASSETQSNAAALKLLRASIDAPKHLSFVGQMETLRWGTRNANATIFRIEHRAPDRTRRWFVAPRALYGDYIVTQGITSYQFDVHRQTVAVSKNPAIEDRVLQEDNYGLLTQNYSIVPGPSENIAGRKAESVIMINKYTGERVMRIWIDAETDLVLQRVLYHGDGSIASQTRFDGLRYTSNIPPEIFATTVPPGYKKIAEHDYSKPTTDLASLAKTAGFTPRNPRFLPEGFVVVSGDVSAVKGVQTIHYLYSDGIRTLSLFENARGAAPDFGKLRPSAIRFENHDGQYVEDGPTTLLTWHEAGLTFALVGELTRRDLARIAASVVP